MLHKDCFGADAQVSVVVEQRPCNRAAASALVLNDYGEELPPDRVVPEAGPDEAPPPSVASDESNLLDAVEAAIVGPQSPEEDEVGMPADVPAEELVQDESIQLRLQGGYWGAFRVSVKRPLGQLRHGGYEVLGHVRFFVLG